MGLLGINILSYARIKLAPDWTPPTPSKQWFWCCRIMTAENVVNQASRLGRNSVRGANSPLVASLCENKKLNPWVCGSGGACSPPCWKCVMPMERQLSGSRAPAAHVAASQINGSRYRCRGVKVFLQTRHDYSLITQQIVSNIGEEVGTVWKKWPGFNEEQNMDHEYFGLDGRSVVKAGEVVPCIFLAVEEV